MSKPTTTIYSLRRLSGSVEVLRDSQPISWRLDLARHSPTGLEFGYGGSGPAQLALAITADYLEDDARALAVYQYFKWAVIAQIRDTSAHDISGAEVLAAVLAAEEEAGIVAS